MTFYESINIDKTLFFREYMKKGFVSQEDFGRKIWGYVADN